MKVGLTLACLSLCWLMPQSWSQVSCHAVVLPDVQINAESISLADALGRDNAVSSRLDRGAIGKLIDPANYLGSAQGFIDQVLAAAKRDAA